MKIDQKIIKTCQTQVTDIIAIYLFGSSGTVYETAESDVDIAVLSLAKLDMGKRLDLINALIGVLHKDKVDVIDLRTAPVVLKFQVIMTGKRIFCSDLYAGDSFEMYTFSDYVRFNTERREILKAIRQRGSVF